MEKICCRCKKSEQEGRWVSDKKKEKKTLSYGFCPHCYEETMAELKMAAMYEFHGGAELRV